LAADPATPLAAPRAAVWDELAAQNAEYFAQHQQALAQRVRRCGARAGLDARL
jgi:hypothetical protein